VPVDLAALLRRYKPERFAATLSPRPPEENVEAAPGRAKMLMMDTCAIIDGLAGRLPAGAVEMLGGALRFHCTVCLAEIAVGIAKRGQGAADTAAVRDRYAALFQRVHDTALRSPTPGVWAAAGLVAGTLARTQRFNPGQHKELFNDAAIYLTAAQHGIPVLTANRKEFDLIQQVAGHGAFVFYRPGKGGGGDEI